SAYYLAVDGAQGEPLLLYLALATAPTSSIFYKPLLIGRTRRANGPEMVINAIPFSPSDHENLAKFAATIDAAFLPRPQGSRTAITVSSALPQTGLPAAFEVFRAVMKRTGKNLAATGVPSTGVLANDVYFAGLWAAIRAGWRDGYSAAIDIPVAADTLDSARETIRASSVFSVFSVDASRRFDERADSRNPSPWSELAVAERFEQSLPAEERAWILDEFVRPFDLGGVVYEFADSEVRCLAVKFGPGLKATEQLHETIRQSRSVLKTGKSFDLELLLEGSANPTTPKELAFCLHWLKARGHAAQLAAPTLGSGEELAQSLTQIAAIARHYQSTLSIRGNEAHGPDVLETIARATLRRVNYRVPEELAGRPGYLQMVADHLVG
ncbi:MAG TPA: hypothetical protein VGH38_04335, partial [Bryobacteraceae bacterium]